MRRPVKLHLEGGALETEALVVSDEMGVVWRPPAQGYIDVATGRRVERAEPEGFAPVLLDDGIIVVGGSTPNLYEALCLANFTIDWENWRADVAATSRTVRERRQNFDAAGGWLGTPKETGQ